jgi:hypothetical protein
MFTLACLVGFGFGELVVKTRFRAGVAGEGRRRLFRLGRAAVNRVENFLAMYGNLFWSNDSQPHFVAADLNDRYGDVIVNDDALVLFSGQYKHCRLSFYNSL